MRGFSSARHRPCALGLAAPPEAAPLPAACAPPPLAPPRGVRDFPGPQHRTNVPRPLYVANVITSCKRALRHLDLRAHGQVCRGESSSGHASEGPRSRTRPSLRLAQPRGRTAGGDAACRSASDCWTRAERRPPPGLGGVPCAAVGGADHVRHPARQTQITGPPAAANYVLSAALPAPPQVCLLRPAASWGCSRVKPSVAGAQDPARNSGRAAVRHVASAPGCAADCDVCWQRGLEGALLRQSWGV